jgi:GxxExxY protein
MEINAITGDIIGSAIEVHKVLGPGLLESSYKECLKYELIIKRYNVKCEVPVPIIYNEVKLECGYRIDLLIEGLVVVELKSIDAIAPVHTAQILTHMKFAQKK